MREILFRGKRKDSGKWIEGAYFKHEPLCVCFSQEKQPDKHLIVFDGFCDWGFEPPIKCVEVIPESIGEYTGLTDKNGTKIFEGDIVEGNRLGGIHRYQICYDKGLARFIGLRGTGYTKFTYDSDAFEIIGNVYDNPELLKERE